MNFQERKRAILNAVNESGSLSVFEIAEKLNTSPATVRRDLQDIAQEGLLLRTHGGAMKIESPVLTSFSAKSGVHEENKERIAALAASYISEGDIIFMDCGSTVFKMCAYLKKKQGVKIVTNSLPVMAELIDAPGLSLNLIGGEIDKQRKAMHGHKAIQHIDGYHAHKAFIGLDGISAEHGLTAHSEHESSITAAFIRNAGMVFALCDSSKIGKDSHVKFAGLAAIKCLFTDQNVLQSQLNALTEKGVEIIIAK